MKLVIIESPYAGETDGEIFHNVKYMRRCLKDSLERGEAPFASHGLYTQPGVLDDLIPEQRARGIRAGQAWALAADLVAVYQDHGTTEGMRRGIEFAGQHQIPVVMRRLFAPRS